MACAALCLTACHPLYTRPALTSDPSDPAFAVDALQCERLFDAAQQCFQADRGLLGLNTVGCQWNLPPEQHRLWALTFEGKQHFLDRCLADKGYMVGLPR